MTSPRINLPVSKLEDEIERLRQETDAWKDRYCRIEKELAECEVVADKLQTRNERLALLVRLIAKGLIELHPSKVNEVNAGGIVHAPYIWIYKQRQIDCTYTNGIPDLTDEQWERLAKLERGEA